MTERQAQLARLSPTAPRFGWLAQWTVPYDFVDEGQLSPIGAEQLYHIGQRLRRRFPSIFSKPYKPYLYTVRTTKKARAAQSGSAFAFGVWEGNGTLGPSRYTPVYQYSHALEGDTVLYPHKNCDAYRRWSKLDNSTKESKAWFAKHELRIKQLVEETLGVASSDLTAADVRVLYDMCGFDLAVFNRTDRFCELFTDKELVALMEYGEDLQVLGVKLYGDEPSDSINWHIGVHTLEDLTRAVDDFIAGSSATRALINLAHAETVAPMIGLLGLFQDDPPLRHTSAPEAIARRRFRASRALPFAANLAVVLYNCTGQWKVRVLHNEVAVPLRHCQGATLCPWEAFKAAHATHLTTDYRELCALRTAGADPTGSCSAA
eukprot:EG_transcript_12029